MPVGPIDLRAYEHVAETIRRLALDQADPGLVAMFRSINVVNPARIDAQVFGVLQNRVAQYELYHEHNPFLVAPRQAFQDGQILLGHEKATGQPVLTTTDDLTRHTLIAGASGSGKTNFLLHLLFQLLTRVQLFILDLKDDLRWVVPTQRSMIPITATTRINLLRVPSYLTPAQHLAIFVDTFADALWGGEATKQVMTEALRKVYATTSSPSMVDLRLTLAGLQRKGDTYYRTNAITNAKERLQRFEGQYPGIATCHAGISIEDLVKHSLYLPVTLLTELDEFLFAYLTTHLYVHHRAQGLRNTLTHLIVLDEGLASFSSRNQHRITGTPLLTGPLGMSREFGIGYLITTNNLTTTDPIVRSNTSTKILMPIEDTDHREATNTFGLKDDQAEYLRTGFTRGECLIRIAHRTPTPVLAVHPVVKIDKVVRLADWQEVLRRTEKMTPPEPVPAVQLPRPPSYPTTQPAPAAAPPAPRPEGATEQRKNAEHRTPGDTRERSVALSDTEERFLRAIVERILPATTHYEKLGLHPQTGTTAKEKLLSLGLITEEKIVVRSGRGGTALALIPTTAGSKRSGIQPPKGTRGGDSVQHQYLVQEFAAALPKSTIECMVGTKSVDLLIAYNTKDHGRLRDYLTAHRVIAKRIAPNDIALNDGGLIAIEVEVSDPLKTAPANVERNHEAGIALTIVAVLPKTLATTITGLKARVPADLHEHFLVVDALGLLDHLRNPGKEA